jgi:hypothetical protein
MSEINKRNYDFLNGGEVTLLKAGKKVFQTEEQIQQLQPKEEPKKKRNFKPKPKEEPKKYFNIIPQKES